MAERIDCTAPVRRISYFGGERQVIEGKCRWSASFKLTGRPGMYEYVCADHLALMASKLEHSTVTRLRDEL